MVVDKPRSGDEALCFAELVKVASEHPRAPIVSDVGASLFSGLGRLNSVSFVEPCDQFPYGFVELGFD